MKQYTIRDEMNSDKQKKKIDYIIKGLDRLAMELRGSTLDDKEFNEIALRTSRFLQEVYSRNANQTRTNKEAYKEALTALRKVRALAKPYK